MNAKVLLVVLVITAHVSGAKQLPDPPKPVRVGWVVRHESGAILRVLGYYPRFRPDSPDTIRLERIGGPGAGGDRWVLSEEEVLRLRKTPVMDE